MTKIVTREMIFNAAIEIAKGNEMPTITTIREALFYCGSNTTIHKYLKEWKMILLSIGMEHSEQFFKRKVKKVNSSVVEVSDE